MHGFVLHVGGIRCVGRALRVRKRHVCMHLRTYQLTISASNGHNVTVTDASDEDEGSGEGSDREDEEGC
jgi:hypothetical protein